MDSNTGSLVPAYPVNGKLKYGTQDYEVPGISPGHMGNIPVEIAILRFFWK